MSSLFVPPATLRDVPRSDAADAYPKDHSALVVPASDNAPAYEMSYAALAATVTAVGKQLMSLLPTGKEEQVVALAMPNTLAFPLGFLGAAWGGAATAPLNPDYKEEEFRFYLEDNNVDLLLVSVEGNPNAEAAAAALSVPVYRLTINPSPAAEAAGSLTWVSGPGPKQLPSPAPSLPPPPPPSKPVMYMHTSGTTSRPKRVRLTHGNLASSLANIQATYELSPSDRTLLVMPLFHVHGLIAGLLTTLASGGSVVIHGKFAASKFWGHVITHGVTWYTAVPTMQQILLMRADADYPKDNPPALRFIRSCSASLAASVLERLETAFGAPVLEAYAMTENAHQMTSNPLPKHGPRKPGSVGKATGTVKVAVLDDKCQALPPGAVGEVCIQGPSVTPGYVNNDEANKTGFEGGWFHTGDQGTLDAEGYLTLTGRLKELINRGGEKISPLEVDAVLLSHPMVGEAVSFAAPDSKYGEEVNAVVIVKPGSSVTVEDILAHCRHSLSDFKLPKKLYIADNVPRTATGKIQRRIVAEHFLKGASPAADSPSSSSSSTPAADASSKGTDGYLLAAKALKAAGMDIMCGVVGIPVTRLGNTAQEVGIRFLAFRNEQAAAYAATAIGYMTGKPAGLLTVSGPGVVHGLAGLANAGTNAWPVVMLSGSTARSNRGKGGGFQELDQLEAARRHAKGVFPVTSIEAIPQAVADAVTLAASGRPGGAYIDLPADVLHSRISPTEEAVELDKAAAVAPTLASIQSAGLTPDPTALASALALLQEAKKPLLVFGKGAAYARAEDELRALVAGTGIPFLATPMGKGVVEDDHPLSAAAARSLVLKEADVVLVVGARLNWILHYGEPPRWNPQATFILVDVVQDLPESERRRHLTGHAKTIVSALYKGLGATNWKVDAGGEWVGAIQAKVAKNSQSMASKLAKVKVPLDYHTTYAVILKAIAALPTPPVIVSEGANTMDIGRSLLNMTTPRARLDAGTWGTMGVGLGYAIGAAAVHGPERCVFAIEGDSAFGFSGMEVETMARYKLKIIVLVFNNNGIYGGKFEGDPGTAFPEDPTPTAFTPDLRYDLVAIGLGARGLSAATPEELEAALAQAIAGTGPTLINIVIDPFCGTESGSLQDHN